MTERLSPLNLENRVSFDSNQDKYHQIFGGRRPVWLAKYSSTPWAFGTRDILIKIAIAARSRNESGTLGEISQDIAIGKTQLSRAAGGFLSNKPMSEYNGQSPRDFVLGTLQNYYQEKYGLEVEYSI